MTRKTWDESLWGHDPVRCKIFVDNECWQEVKNFKYLGSKVSYENKADIQ